jgi:hypothetical protein
METCKVENSSKRYNKNIAAIYNIIKCTQNIEECTKKVNRPKEIGLKLNYYMLKGWRFLKRK